MLFSILSGGDIKDIIIDLLLSLPVIILALTVHETAHGYVAWKCGDPTAYNLGRLTLNPIKHLDPFGFLCMLIFGYGWAKPVPINTRNFRNPKRGMALSAAAGPLANLLLGAISAALSGLLYSCHLHFILEDTPLFILKFFWYGAQLFELNAIVNLLLMAFNLIPVPPFDGSRIALIFLPTRIYFKVMQYEQQIMFGVLIAFFLLNRIGYSPFSMLSDFMTCELQSLSFDLFGKMFNNPEFSLSGYLELFY